MLKYGSRPNKNYNPISEEIMKQNGNKSKLRINKVEVTMDTLTGRCGMALFVRYIEKVGICGLLLSAFGYIRKSSKGPRSGTYSSKYYVFSMMEQAGI